MLFFFFLKEDPACFMYSIACKTVAIYYSTKNTYNTTNSPTVVLYLACCAKCTVTTDMFMKAN